MRSALLSLALIATLLSSVAAAEAKYPVVNEVELLEKVKKEGLELMKAGKTKGSKQLCKQLHERATCELVLPPALTEPVGDKELYARACESIFIVVGMAKSPEEPTEWEFSSATGFAVTADGVLSTSRHVFGDPEPLEAFFTVNVAGEVAPVEEILAADEKKDTCLFRIPTHGLKPLPLGENAAPGAKVRVVSHPGFFFYFFSGGSVGNYFQDEDKTTWLNVTADFGQGSSGAPVFDDCGNVVGQVGSTMTLTAAGGLATTDPMIKCRRLTADRRVVVAEKPPREGTPKGKEKKKKREEPTPLPELAGDVQMVFKTCTPADGLRSLVKVKAEGK